MNPVGMALQRAGLAFALLGLLLPGMAVLTDARAVTCTEGTGLQGVDLNLDCHGDTCDFDESIATHAHLSLSATCHQDGEESPGKLTLKDADQCVSCDPKANAETMVCKNVGDQRQNYTVTVFCR